MKEKALPLLVLAGAVAALAASIAWAVVEATDSDRGPRFSGPVMMGSGMMSPGSGTAGPGMMGYAPGSGAKRVEGLEEARRLAQRFADGLGLAADEVLRFERNYYVKLVDRQGRGATEVLVDPATGFVSLEYGPAMMWNTRYGMMGDAGGMMGSYGRMMGGMMGGGMMGGGSEYPDDDDSDSPGMKGGGMMGGGMMGGGSEYPDDDDAGSSGMMGGTGMMGGMMGGGMMGGGMMGGGSTGSAPGVPGSRTAGEPGVSPEQAAGIAERWLRENGIDAGVEDAEAFPGYYTLETLRGETVDRMLSVNASTGDVIYHWWHGRFLDMLE